jgi:uncharacterized protein (DUF302 family)
LHLLERSKLEVKDDTTFAVNRALQEEFNLTGQSAYRTNSQLPPSCEQNCFLRKYRSPRVNMPAPEPQRIAPEPHGIESVRSSRSFSATLDHFEALLKARGMTVFARIAFDHDAANAGLQMPPTRLLIFGNPKAGTPVMLAAPSSALDLPLKVLISEDADGSVWITYNTPEYLAERHAIPQDLVKNLAGIRALVQAAAS